jgi:hypothetical protein
MRLAASLWSAAHVARCWRSANSILMDGDLVNR